ncbi:hypothetical protein B0H13DRAFT_1897502 [Mycena leptocephala]|nr:hypothetical protein B0H13DRAFT_1897502 [Mycena leptocephala]
MAENLSGIIQALAVFGPLMCPSMALPYEILYLISLSFLLDGVAISFDEPSDVLYQYIFRRYILCSVSPVWHRAVHSTPKFWTCIVVQPPVHVLYLEKWVGNCKTHPVTTAVQLPDADYSTVKGVFDIIARVIGHCTSLSVSLSPALSATLGTFLQSAPLDRLEILVVRSPQSFSPIRPSPYTVTHIANTFMALRSLRIYHGCFGWSPYMSFTSLHVLALANFQLWYYPTWDNYKLICHCAPSLTHVSLKGVGCQMLPAGMARAGYFSPLLHLIELVIAFPDDITLIPVLSHLYIDIPSNMHAQELFKCRQAFYKTTALHYLSGQLSYNNLAVFLQLMPFMTAINIITGHSTLFAALLDVPGGSVVFPALERISVGCSPLKYRRVNLKFANVVPILEVRNRDQSQVRDLNRILTNPGLTAAYFLRRRLYHCMFLLIPVTFFGPTMAAVVGADDDDDNPPPLESPGYSFTLDDSMSDSGLTAAYLKGLASFDHKLSSKTRFFFSNLLC